MIKIANFVSNTIAKKTKSVHDVSHLSKEHTIVILGLGDLTKIGGVQSSYVELTRCLLNSGYRVILFNHLLKKDFNPKDFTYPLPEGVEVKSYVLADQKDARQPIRDKISALKPDVILIVNSSRMSLLALLALRDLDIPIILSERGGADFNLRYNWNNRLTRQIAHNLCVRSHFLMESYRVALPAEMQDQITIIPSAIEPSQVGFASPDQPNQDGRYSLLYVGRLSFEKDVNLLIRSFLELRDQTENWDLVICGDGPEKKSLYSLIEKLTGVVYEKNKDRAKAIFELPAPHLGSRIIFTGARNQHQVMKLYTKCHLFALPSRAEGCPLALREAMAYGLPVIGYASASGVNEIIKHDENGLLASADNRLEGMKHALAILMKCGKSRKQYGAKGIVDTEKYASGPILDLWINLVEKTLAEAEDAKDKRTDNPYRRWLLTLTDELSEIPKIAGAWFYDEHDIDPGINRFYLICFGSVLFDPDWYSNHYFAVKRNGFNPLAHYLQIGYKNGNAFHPEINVEEYRNRFMVGIHNDDMSPLVHLCLNAADIAATDFLPTPLRNAVRDENWLGPNLDDPRINSIARQRPWEKGDGTWRYWRRMLTEEFFQQQGSGYSGAYDLNCPPLILSRKSRFTFVVPAFNAESTVGRTIASIYSMNNSSEAPDLEVIAVNDGSTDGTAEVLEKIKCKYPGLSIISQDNQGLSGARNTGIEHSSGDWIGFCDADDVIRKEAMSALIACAGVSTAGIVGGVFNRVSRNGNEQVIKAFQKAEFIEDFAASPTMARRHCTNFSSCNKLWSRQALSKIGEGFRHGLYMQDIEFWLRTLNSGIAFEQTDLVVADYIDTPGSFSQSIANGRLASIFRLYDYIRLVYPNDSPISRHIADAAFLQGAINFFLRRTLTMWHAQACATGVIPSIIQRISRVLNDMPEASIETLYLKNRGPVVYICTLVRSGYWREACQLVLRKTPADFREFGQSNRKASYSDIEAFGLKSAKS